MCVPLKNVGMVKEEGRGEEREESVSISKLKLTHFAQSARTELIDVSICLVILDTERDKNCLCMSEQQSMHTLGLLVW